MRHEMLTQRALFSHRTNTKRGTLSQHFVTCVVPPLGKFHSQRNASFSLPCKKSCIDPWSPLDQRKWLHSNLYCAFRPVCRDYSVIYL